MPKLVEFTYTDTPKKAVTKPNDPKPTEPPPTAEELEQRKKDLYQTMGWKLDKEKPETPEVTPAPAEPSPPKDTPPALSPTPAPEPPAVPKEPGVSGEDLEEVARLAAKQVLDQQPKPVPTPPPASPPPAPALEMSTEDADDLKVVQFLERIEPDKFKGSADKFTAYIKAFYAYQDGWSAKQENTDQTFDPDDSEHSPWYANNEPGVNESQLEYGRRKMLKQEVYEEMVKPEIDQFKREKAINQALPEVYGTLDNHLLKLVEVADPKLGALVSADGKPAFTKENLDKVAKASPIASAHLSRAAAELTPLLIALEMTKVPAANYQLNPERDQGHAKIAEYVRKAEKEMVNAPAEVRVQGGKEFATLAQFHRMSQSIQDSSAIESHKQQLLEGLDDRYYTLTPADIQAFMVSDYAEQARIGIEKERDLAKREFGSGNDSTQPAVVTPEPPPSAQPQPTSTKPRSPSASSGADTVPAHVPGVPEQKKFGEQMAEVMWRK